MEEKATSRDGNLRMLICGPTVYDFSHLGHARILLFYDLVARYLILSGKANDSNLKHYGYRSQDIVTGKGGKIVCSGHF